MLTHFKLSWLDKCLCSGSELRNGNMTLQTCAPYRGLLADSVMPIHLKGRYVKQQQSAFLIFKTSEQDIVYNVRSEMAGRAV